MGSLLEEYRKRHGIESVWPVNEGVLFFNRKGKPSLIAITSSFSKGFHVCPACPKNTDAIVLEVFSPYHFPHTIQRVVHTHMPPDADLLQYIRKHVSGGDGHEPYVSKGERDQERWAWEFFLQSQPFDQIDIWKTILEQQKKSEENPDHHWLEQAMWAVEAHPEAFRNFYLGVYSLSLVNRRYILQN